MPPVRVKFVVSFSSQDTRHTLDNLIKGAGSWLTNSTDKSGRLQADLQLERATTIDYLDLGNSGSVMISVEVGRSSWPSSQPLVTLLPTVALMTPAEWRSGKNSTAVRMFKQNDFSSAAVKEKWDRVRVVCTQPFRKDMQFGLSLFQLHTNSEAPSVVSVPAISIPKEVFTSAPQTTMKKEELVSRMNLPTVKKKAMSQNIGWLENKVLTNGEEPSAGPPSNPLTSPVSRAARLVVMASKPASKADADSKKVTLECEALEFLISLNLTIADINTMKVSGVRRNFEAKRQKELTNEEKQIFKDMALDYASERLRSLELQQEKVAQRGKSDATPRRNAGKHTVNLQNKTSLSKTPRKNVTQSKIPGSVKDKPSGTGTPECTEAKGRGIIQKPGSKFTFKSINSPGGQERPGKPSVSPHNISLGRQKLREEDSLDFAGSSGSSRNDIALADSRVATPKRSWNGKVKNSPHETKENQQPNLDAWFICKPKRMKEDSHTLCPAPDVKPLSSSKDNRNEHLSPPSKLDTGKVAGGGFLIDPIPTIIKHNSDAHTCTSIGSLSDPQELNDGYLLGSAPTDRYGRHQKEVMSSGGESPNHSSNCSVMVECPVCSGLYKSAAVEAHAASCGIFLSSDSETDIDDSSPTNHTKSQENVEECPVCGDFVNSKSLEVHASACAASAFG